MLYEFYFLGNLLILLNLSTTRNCIGKLLAYLIVKVCIVEVVRNFKIVKTPRTPQRLELDPRSPMAHVKCGIWVKFERRD